jgi:hypothetical protein
LSSRLRKKVKKLEEITGVHAEIENREGSPVLLVDIVNRTWEQKGSVRELMMFMEGFIVAWRREHYKPSTPMEVDL